MTDELHRSIMAQDRIDNRKIERKAFALFRGMTDAQMRRALKELISEAQIEGARLFMLWAQTPNWRTDVELHPDAKRYCRYVQNVASHIVDCFGVDPE